MKTPVAAAISIAAVLVAGTAAAVVNTEVLQNSPNESGASAAVLPPPSTVALSVPEPTLPPPTSPSTTIPDPRVESTLPPATTEPAPIASGMLTAYSVGESGVVTVDVLGGRLVLVAVEPLDGWTVLDEYEEQDDDEIEVTFRSATVDVEFSVRLVDGEIVTEVESERRGGGSTSAAPGSNPAVTVPSSPAGSTPPNTIDGDDDDRDDEYEDHDDEHDDDEHDDDEHDDDEHDDDEHEDDEHEDEHDEHEEDDRDDD